LATRNKLSKEYGKNVEIEIRETGEPKKNEISDINK
jgi:hypothetical protein